MLVQPPALGLLLRAAGAPGLLTGAQKCVVQALSKEISVADEVIDTGHARHVDGARIALVWLLLLQELLPLLYAAAEFLNT